MALETNLNTTPYWDDYNELKNFHRILFKPGVSVQTRELNQIQSILQNQIERFGDHVFKSGTIVSGINFDYNPLFPYIKILDVTDDGQPVNPSSYVGLYVKNSSNLQALVCKHESGFETKDPDLNTLYLKYLNSGSNQNTAAFSNSELLEVFNRNNQLFKVTINNGGLGFSNSDTLHIVSAITVNVASGTFTNNEIITQSTTGARVQIVGIFNDPEFTTRKILSIKPINSEQLSNTSANSTTWTVQDGYNVTGNTSSAVANVLFSVGSGATGVIATDSLGVVQTITLSSGGAGYITDPQVVIKPTSATASVSTLDLTASKNYAKLRVASGSYTNPVGYGYSFSITEGIIYQKGIFSRVSPQTVVVSKYSSTPANVMIGFRSDESIVKYTTDSSLYDNAANTLNESAPGADRLKINPTLYVVNSEIGAANSEFLPLVEFVDGFPARENRDSVYNQLSKEFERRTFETAGNFVINSFDVTSKEIASNNTHVKINVNPGVAYVSGKRVQTISGTSVNIEKSNTYKTSTNLTITANYGNYLKVKELAGEFQFHIGAEVDLYDTAHQRLTNITVGSSATITPSGNKIGTARIRSLVYESGTVGTPDAVFRLYVFDISMNAGKNFRDVRSVYYNGTYDGICDVVRETESTTNNQVSYIYDTENPDVIFRSRLFGVKSIYDLSYTYRTSNNSLTLYSNGSIEISHPTNVFPYGGSTTLSGSQKKDFTIIPTANVDVANASGSVSCNTASPNLVGTSTTFSTDYKPGDYIKVKETGGGSATDVRRVEQVVNNTLLVLNSNLSFTDTNADTALFFPSYYPINLDRTDRTIVTDPTPTTARVNIGNSSLSSSVTVIAHYNLKITSASQINKDLNRDLYVKIYTGNNNTVSASGNNFTGPWSLGVPDVFRLKNVYFGNTVNDTDVTKYFYVNSQDDGDKVKNAHLTLKRNAGIEISNTQWLLVKFDAFDVNSSEGYVTRDSYSSILNDNSGYSNSTYINTLEIPEVLTAEGRYYDGIDSIDFRPFVDNTAIMTSTVASATVNPANSQNINTDEKFIPLPDSEIIFDADYYVPRIDRIYVTSKNEVKSATGTPNIIGNLIAPINPTDSMSVSRIFVPPYPSIPFNYSNTTFQILDRKVGNDTSIVNNRENLYKLKNITSTNDNRAAPTGYSMARINKLERRIDSLEKEILLTKLENSILEKVIPSSTNPAKNRFKNGFLVDSFDNHNIVDLKNVENSCFIDTDTGELLPTRFSYNLENIFDRSHSNTVSCISGGQAQFICLPYEEITIIKQLNASLPRNVLPPANNNTANITTVTVGSNTVVNTNPITNTAVIVANVEPILQGPATIKEDDEFRVQITKARTNELVTFVGSYNWTSGAFLSTTGSFNADAGGSIEYYEPKWLAGTGTFTWEFTFNTSGWNKKLTTVVTAKGQQNVAVSNTSTVVEAYSLSGTSGGVAGAAVVVAGVATVTNDGNGAGSTVLELSTDWTEENLGLSGTGNDSITGDDIIVIEGDQGYTYDTYDNTDLLNNEGNNEGLLVVEDGADSSVLTIIGDDSEFLNSLDGGEAAAAMDSLGGDQTADNDSSSDSGTRYGDQYDVDVVGNDAAIISNETIGDDVISNSDGYGDSYSEFGLGGEFGGQGGGGYGDGGGGGGGKGGSDEEFSNFVLV